MSLGELLMALGVIALVVGPMGFGVWRFLRWESPLFAKKHEND